MKEQYLSKTPPLLVIGLLLMQMPNATADDIPKQHLRMPPCVAERLSDERILAG